jgi:hypothetical protein
MTYINFCKLRYSWENRCLILANAKYDLYLTNTNKSQIRSTTFTVDPNYKIASIRQALPFVASVMKSEAG